MKSFLKKIIKFFRPVYWPVVKTYFKYFSPETRGVRVILTHNGEVLFIKNSYGLKYNFPGGNLSKKEDSRLGAIREVKEELGIDIEEVNFLGDIIPPIEFEYRKNTISVFNAELPSKKISVNNLEIADFMWKPKSAPPSMGHTACMAFELYRSSNILH